LKKGKGEFHPPLSLRAKRKSMKKNKAVTKKNAYARVRGMENNECNASAFKKDLFFSLRAWSGGGTEK
jgi:hypothetical protein